MRNRESRAREVSRERGEVREVQVCVATGETDSAVDEAQFDEITKSATVPVLVDFWADCVAHATTPEVARTASDMAGKAIVLKVDTERNPHLSARFNIRGIPNFMVFARGRSAPQQAGAVDHTQMGKVDCVGDSDVCVTGDGIRDG